MYKESCWLSVDWVHLNYCFRLIELFLSIVFGTALLISHFYPHRLHEQLMDLQQRQIDELAAWLRSAEAKIEANDPVGSDNETIKRQIEAHKVDDHMIKSSWITKHSQRQNKDYHILYLTLKIQAVTKKQYPSK